MFYKIKPQKETIACIVIIYDYNQTRFLLVFCHCLRQFVCMLFSSGDVKFYEVLSLDLLRNSVMALVELRVLKASKR